MISKTSVKKNIELVIYSPTGFILVFEKKTKFIHKGNKVSYEEDISNCGVRNFKKYNRLFLVLLKYKHLVELT